MSDQVLGILERIRGVRIRKKELQIAQSDLDKEMKRYETELEYHLDKLFREKE